MFDMVPVVLTSPLRLGSISQVEGRLLLDPDQLVAALSPASLVAAAERLRAYTTLVRGAEAARDGMQAAREPTPPAALLPEMVAVQAPDEFCIPYENMLND
jgi:hypothetical protein